MFANPFESPGRWLKANLHTHTTTSDGDTPVAERCRQYREHGYQVLAITDHDKTNDVSAFSVEDFLVISGMETHPACPNGDPYHIVILDVPLDFHFTGEQDAQSRISTVKAAGGEVMIAHPYWCGHNLNHLLPLEGVIAVEVYNATCTKIGKGYSSVQWDDLLAAGRVLPAVAVDDAHSGRDQFMGWTMIKAAELTAKAVMDALRTGCFYASCGPVIEDVRLEDSRVKVKCSPVAEVHFVGRTSNGWSHYADGGKPITSIEQPVSRYWDYVRVEVVDEMGNHAWTNPLILG